MLISKAYVNGLIKSMKSGSEEAYEKLYKLAATRLEEGRAHHNQLIWMAREAIETASA